MRWPFWFAEMVGTVFAFFVQHGNITAGRKDFSVQSIVRLAEDPTDDLGSSDE